HQARFASTGESALTYMQKSNFDPYAETIIETDDSSSAGQIISKGTPNPNDRMQRLPSSQNRVSLVSDTASPGFLVLTETWYPGWQATVDGNFVPIYKANHLFRAIEIPQGKHKVEMSFSPRSFWLGVWLFLAGLAVVALRLFRF